MATGRRGPERRRGRPAERADERQALMSAPGSHHSCSTVTIAGRLAQGEAVSKDPATEAVGTRAGT